ncbi:MAG: dihydrolipoamide succinyltransferase, partial [Gammaproteobacteria bacterium]
MSIEIRVPTLPESVADATLISWHKQVGDAIQKGENLVDLETDKVVLEVPAPESGILTEIITKDDSTVKNGDLLAIIDTDSKPGANDLVSAKKTNDTVINNDIPLSPAVRRIIFENDLDPKLISGTGKGGRITKSDVQDYLNQNIPAQAVPTKASSPEPRVEDAGHAELKTDSNMPKKNSSTSARSEQRVPMTRLRAKVAERLLQAQQNAAMLTTFNEVNMQSVIDLRKQYQDRFIAKHDVKLGFMSFFIKASIEALKRFPAINASIDGEDIIYHGYYDIGIAVASPRGLIVPVLRDAD